MLFSVNLYSLTPQVQTVPSHVLCAHSLFLPFCFVPEVIACVHQHPLALTGFSRVPSGCSSTKEKSQKRHLQLFVELLSLHKTAPVPGDPCLECEVRCCRLHADTIITSWLRKDWKAGCFYGLQDLHINIIHFNSTIIPEVMPGVKRENVFLAGLQIFPFFLFLWVGAETEAGLPRPASTADASSLCSCHMEAVQRFLDFILRKCFEVFEWAVPN